MLDALLAEEKIPDEYSGQTQVYSALSPTVLAQCYERFTSMDCDTLRWIVIAIAGYTL
jgi:hypothetical protein